jgi:hypothetical protein
MSKYYVMDPAEALRYLRARDAGEEPALAEFERVSGDGDFADDTAVKKLVTELRALKKKFPEELRGRDEKGKEFEQKACEIVHRCFPGYEPAAIANPDFWTWLAVARLSDIVEWRFGARGKHANPANYGIGARVENLLFRLWLRGEFGKDGKGNYSLAKTGDQDLWRSHILRPAYTNARPIATALLKLQAGLLKAKKLHSSKPDGVRMLAKRLSRLRANLMFEYLNLSQAEALVEEMSVDLRKAA